VSLGSKAIAVEDAALCTGVERFLRWQWARSEDWDVRNAFTRFAREECGQDLIEYGLILGLITAISVLGITAIGIQTKAFYTTLCTAIGGSC
jgi:Flp pilus assembly pilin Flp